ncbi:MAG TPA: hypothetical protein DDY20_06040 [Desulfobulbaceae bacterium]|nr:hypothetical protein [Desulfobulbaceae bacterium]
MKTAIQQKILRSSLGLLAALLLLFSSGLKVPVLDAATDAYFREAITKAGVTYATCRVINASVSVVKDSSLQLEPAGVGLSLAVGQSLDPIDDMTERLSDVLVTAITSLGVQKLAYEMSVSLAPPLLSVLLLAVSLLIWFEKKRLTLLHRAMTQFILLLVVARFCLPVSALANEYLQKHFFADRIAASTKELAVGTAELDKLADVSLPEIDGVLGTIENSALFLKRKSAEFKNVLVVTVTNAGDIIENLLELTFLYVGIFLIQVVILPLLSFWILVKTAATLFPASFPVVVRNSRPSSNEDGE